MVTKLIKNTGIHTKNKLQHRSYIRPQTNLSKFKKTEISSIFSYHKGMKLELNYQKMEDSQICVD